MVDIKQCSKCKQSKSSSEFYIDRSKKDGLTSYCKLCQKKYQQSTKYKTAEKIRENRYVQTDKGRANRRKAAKKYQNSAKGKAMKRVRLRCFYARNPNYAKAVNVTNHAVQAGKIPRPDSLLCRYCPKPAQQYHHWHGYEPEHWLDVVPTCIDCHKKRHRRIA